MGLSTPKSFGTIPRVLALAALAATTSCGAARSDLAAPAGHERAAPRGYGAAVRLGRLEDKAITESSGVVASRRNRGLYWTHNDSSGAPAVFAFDRSGAARGTWRLGGARAVDWEDIAAGPGPKRGASYIYVGDIGDNRGRRSEIVVYRVEEPAVPEKRPAATQTIAAEAIRLRYPDGARDAEALLVHPTSGDLYVVTKAIASSAGVYKAAAPLAAGKVVTLKRVGTVDAGGLLGSIVTGGDISPDGQRVVLCDYFRAYEYTLPKGARSFDAIWKETPREIALERRDQGEAICYRLDGEAILTTSEGRGSPLVEYARKK